LDRATPIRQTAGCSIDQNSLYIFASVGPGLADEVQECYRAFAGECLQRHCGRALVIGRAYIDAFHHLALRDALRAMGVAGVPPEFRIALVAETPDLIAVYDAAVVEAGRCGIEARRFPDLPQARRWLAQ
jgi:hypothetical protein